MRYYLVRCIDIKRYTSRFIKIRVDNKTTRLNGVRALNISHLTFSSWTKCVIKSVTIKNITSNYAVLRYTYSFIACVFF